MFKKLFSLTKKEQDAQLRAIPFLQYDFETAQHPGDHEPLALKVATLLLASPIDLDTQIREQATVFLNQWMYYHTTRNFGSGNMRYFLQGRQDLGQISVAAQVQYCLQHNVRNTYDSNVLVQVYGSIANYILNPVNNVQITPMLQHITDAHIQGRMADLINANM